MGSTVLNTNINKEKVVVRIILADDSRRKNISYCQALGKLRQLNMVD